MALREHFVALFFVGAALGMFSAARFYMVTWIGERVTADLRNAVYAHVLRQSPEFFETTQTGEVLSRLTTDTTLVQTVVGSSLSMGLRNTVMGLGALAMLIVTNPYVMTQVLGILVLVVLPSLLFGRRVRTLSAAPARTGWPIPAPSPPRCSTRSRWCRATCRSRSEAARFGRATEEAFETARKRTRVRAALVAFIITATFGALLWGLYQGTQAVIAGTISAGHLGQTVVYVIILVGSVAVLSRGLWRSAARGRRHRAPDGIAGRTLAGGRPAMPRALPARERRLGGGVRAGELQLPFAPAARGACATCRCRCSRGETVALVGPSGAGKSTVFQLLLRFYDVSSGSVRLDGVPVRELELADLRGRIGIVPQDSTVFSTSAMENIRYGRPDASDAEVIAAARAAFAHEFISALPEGYASFLGERGVRLSGGQRQRIAIARAMLKNPPLLLLDEATSALDAESERMVQAALEAAMRDRTTLVIAHRLATVQRADRIVVLDAGPHRRDRHARRAGGARRLVRAAGGDAVRPRAGEPSWRAPRMRA